MKTNKVVIRRFLFRKNDNCLHRMVINFQVCAITKIFGKDVLRQCEKKKKTLQKLFFNNKSNIVIHNGSRNIQ